MISWETTESCLCGKVRFDLEEEREGVPSKTKGVKLEISFVSQAGRMEAQGERTEVKLEWPQPVKTNDQQKEQ